MSSWIADIQLTYSYSHTLNLTPLLPYIQSLNRLSASHRHGDGEKEDKRPYLASDLPSHLARDPLTPESNGKSVCKTTLLSFIVKTLLLAMEEHPIMRSRAREADGGKERWLEVARDGTIAVAVSGESSARVSWLQFGVAMVVSRIPAFRFTLTSSPHCYNSLSRPGGPEIPLSPLHSFPALPRFDYPKPRAKQTLWLYLPFQIHSHTS